MKFKTDQNIAEKRIKELSGTSVSKKGKDSAKKPKKRKESVSSLAKKLDKVFSQFIRLRDTDEDGWGRCCTCDKPQKYIESHCGHFIVRGRKITRWEEKNCNLQCPGCNTYRCGEQYLHGKYIDSIDYKGVAKWLYETSREEFKPGLPFLRSAIERYKSKVKELLIDKNFTL